MCCRYLKLIPLLLVLSACAAAQTASSFARIVDHSVVVTDPAQVVSVSKFDIQPLDIDKLYMTRPIGESAWSSDGKQIAFINNITGSRNVWIVSAEGGWPLQLTLSNQRQSNPAWSPTGRWIAYQSDTDGNEQWDIFLVSPRDGQVINLTNSADISEENPAWSPDGERLAYMVKPRHSAAYEIDVMEIASRTVTHLTSNTPRGWSNTAPIWSHDGKQIVFTRMRADYKDSDVFMIQADGKAAVNLTPHQGEHVFSATDVSPDGKTILVSSNAENGYLNAALLDIATKKMNWLTHDKWEATSGQFFPDGKIATWMANVEGNVEVFSYNIGSGQATKLPLPQGLNTLAGANTAFAGTRLLYNHDGAISPSDLWTYDFTSGQSRQITHALMAGMRSEDMVEPFLVHYPSKDGKWQISAFVYVPYNAERNGKNAAVVFIHGGPNAQYMNWFNRSVQYLANQGFFVIVPNYRGSSGYGKEFEDANRFDMGGGDLDDIVSAADWMVKTGFVDPKKIALYGGSYGGYLTMMAATKFPDRWAAAAPWIPFVNWFTELENTDPAIREYAIANMGDPRKDKDKERLHDRSPIFFVDQIKAPVLLLAGGKDPRCPPSEAEQVASAIKKNNGVVELKIYDNEGHGFTRLENQIDSVRRVGEFLKKYDPPEKCGCNLNQP